MTLSLINAAICLSAKANAVSAFRCREVGSAGARAGLSEVIPGRDISVQRSAFSFHFSLAPLTAAATSSYAGPGGVESSSVP